VQSGYYIQHRKTIPIRSFISLRNKIYSWKLIIAHYRITGGLGIENVNTQAIVALLLNTSQLEFQLKQLLQQWPWIPMDILDIQGIPWCGGLTTLELMRSHIEHVQSVNPISLWRLIWEFKKKLLINVFFMHWMNYQNFKIRMDFGTNCILSKNTWHNVLAITILFLFLI
jgi:hypothetical protein